MTDKTTEALKLAEEALAGGLWDYGPGQDEHTKCEEVLVIIREALADHIANVGKVIAEPVKQEPVAWHDKIKGMEVSVDVSTGEDDDYYRVFGRVDGVMLESCGAQNDIILVIEESRNFAAPVAMSQAEQDKQEPVAWGLAEKVRRDLDRQSCPDAYMRIAMESIVKHFPATPPVQEITEDVDAAMVEMKNIYPPLRRSECERLIRAAKYAAPVDAKAIRAEALEEAEEIAKTIGGSFSVEFLAAIRGLK